jgi:uncharacterized protein (TIGR02996 family)
MNEREAFLRTLLDDPGEANRLVFADWLTEHGEEEPARWFRQARGPVEVAWAIIHDWLARHHPTMLPLLNGTADAAAFAELERRVGRTLPEDFKNSYRVHDGSESDAGILIGLPLMSLKEIGDTWEMWAAIADDTDLVEEVSEDRRSHPPGAVKPLYANRGWVPFAGDGQHNVALDFDPGPAVRVGQVINCGRDDEILHVIAGSFAGFLMFVARRFVLGRVGLGEDEDEDEPRRLAVDGGRRDLLTGLRDLLGLTGEKRA